MDVTSDVISIATISGAATSFGANQFPSGSRSKHVLDVYSTPYPEIKPDPTVLTPSAVHAVCRTPVNRSTVTTATTAATTSTTKVPTVTICKAGTTPTPNNGQVVTIYSFEEGCEGGRGEGQVVVSQESGENKLSALGKKPVAGKAMEKGVTIEDTERKGAPPRRAILGQARGGQADTDTKQGQTAASTPHGDSSTLINAKAGTCSYSSNGTCNRTVTFESSGVSLTEPSADLEGEFPPQKSATLLNGKSTTFSDVQSFPVLFCLLLFVLFFFLFLFFPRCCFVFGGHAVVAFFCCCCFCCYTCFFSGFLLLSSPFC